MNRDHKGRKCDDDATLTLLTNEIESLKQRNARLVKLLANLDTMLLNAQATCNASRVLIKELRDADMI